MSKFSGVVGYSVTTETKPGVWSSSNIVRKNVTGEILKNTSKQENESKVNKDVVLNNRISIIADSELTQNFKTIKFVEFRGIAWDVPSVEVAYPRLILTLGGVYNG